VPEYAAAREQVIEAIAKAISDPLQKVFFNPREPNHHCFSN
jgi:acetoin utilization deacetylase AcuC-like enzyme